MYINLLNVLNHTFANKLTKMDFGIHAKVNAKVDDKSNVQIQIDDDIIPVGIVVQNHVAEPREFE